MESRGRLIRDDLEADQEFQNIYFLYVWLVKLTIPYWSGVPDLEMIRAIFSTNLTLCDSPIRFYLATSFYTLFNISWSCETLWNYDWYLFCPTCIFNLFFLPILSSFFIFFPVSSTFLISFLSLFICVSFYLFVQLCSTLFFYPVSLYKCLFLHCLILHDFTMITALFYCAVPLSFSLSVPASNISSVLHLC